MSKIKRWIESENLKGNDPLHEDHEDFIDDVYQYEEYKRYEEWCHYSGMPSPSAYENSQDSI
jgi:hypothetical protein